MLTFWPLLELRTCTDPWLQWDDSTVRTVRTAPGRDRPATYSMVPVPGELPVATWRLEHGGEINGSVEEHAHDFPGLAYFQTTGGLLRTGRRTWPIEAGDLFVIAPGDVMGRVQRRRHPPDAISGMDGLSVEDLDHLSRAGFSG